MRATGINHVSVGARDLAESVRLSTEARGLEPVDSSRSSASGSSGMRAPAL